MMKTGKVITRLLSALIVARYLLLVELMAVEARDVAQTQNAANPSVVVTRVRNLGAQPVSNGS